MFIIECSSENSNNLSVDLVDESGQLKVTEVEEDVKFDIHGESTEVTSDSGIIFHLGSDMFGNPLYVGVEVEVGIGKYKGYEGTVISISEKKLVLELFHNKARVTVMKSSVFSCCDDFY